MDENEARAMKDRHSRDEAEMRRAQQRSAGTGHLPVEAYPQHGAHPDDPVAGEAGAVEAYEAALRKEQSAWQRLKSLRQESDLAVAWHEWRSAVEERDRATRLLINRSLEEITRAWGSPVPDQHARQR
jgi:hypothetical protein